MTDIIEFIKSQSVIVIIIIILILIFIYTMLAVLLNKLNNAKHGKTTILAWIPGLNIFLLGKLTIHWIIGIILFIGLLFGIIVSCDIKGLESIKGILPNQYVQVYQIVYLAIIVILFICAKLKTNKIIREGTGKDEMTTYISKDYEELAKEPKIVDEKPVVEEQIKDNYQYNNGDAINNSNHTSLNDLNNQNNEENPK